MPSNNFNISQDLKVFGNTTITGNTIISGSTTIIGNVVFSGSVSSSPSGTTLLSPITISGISASSQTNYLVVDGSGRLSYNTSGGGGGGTFTGGVVTGATSFTGGLSANTVSATTYQNLPFSGTVRNSGTTTSNFIPRWTGTTALTNSQIQDDGTNISIGQSPVSPYRFFINDQNTGTTNSFVVNGGSATSKTAIRGASNATQYGTGVYGSASSSVESIGLDGLTLNGTLAIGVRGVATPDEFTNITTGIGGYFASDDSYGYGLPTNRYSVQLKDGTEGTNKVLVSTTSDGKANWSSSLTGLTSVSATTYYNLPISGLTQGSNITITNNGNGNFTIASTGGGGGGLTFQQVQMIAFLTS
jgi:hypothetical protein